MIGSLMYLTASRHDIMYAVCACSRFQVALKTSHLHDVKRIFRYLKGQPKLGIWYPRESAFDLEAYLDSDYAGANLDRKSTTGGCQFLGRRLISWQCKKQTIMATSTTKVEYVAAANCCGQVLWIQNQMLDYGFNFMNIKIYIDNESIIWGKSKTGLIIKEGNFNKLDDLVGEGVDYAVNEGRSIDKIKVLNAEAEGVSSAGSRMKSLSKRQKTNANLEEEEQLRVFLNIIPDEEREVDYAVLDKSSPCLTDLKNLLVQKQTALGKDFSNPLLADSLPKTIWFSTHHAS
nr:uncharacterized mitochondrial protein AtMg00810-like [Tanacetum cinerariifolium]